MVALALVAVNLVAVLGHPLLIGGICVVCLGILLLHGLVIWQEPLERALALGEVVAVVALTVYLARRGAFAARGCGIASGGARPGYGQPERHSPLDGVPSA
jgi:hypothetical protein